MSYRIVVAALFVIALLSFSYAADQPTYQEGKIVSIQKKADATPSGGSDAPLQSNTASYNVLINTGGTDYRCVYRTSGDLDPTWAEGKQAQVRVSGKVVYVKKANGSTEKCSIVSKKPAK